MTLDYTRSVDDIPASDPPAEPSIADGAVRPLDPRYVDLQVQTGWITAGVAFVLALAGSVLMMFVRGLTTKSLLVAVSLCLLIALLTWWLVRWPAVAYRFASYRVDGDGLEIRSGVYFRSVTTVPRSRVQHTDVSQGPLQRRYGLATLTVHTAGSENAEVELPGLPHEVALKIRDHLLPGNTADAV